MERARMGGAERLKERLLGDGLAREDAERSGSVCVERDSMGRTSKVQRVFAWMKRASMWRKRRVQGGSAWRELVWEGPESPKERRVSGSRQDGFG